MLKFEKFSLSKVKVIMTKDNLENITTTPQDYMSDNLTAYFLLVNTWYNVCAEYAPFSAELLADLFWKKGVLYCIKYLTTESDKFIHESGDFEPFSLQLMNELTFDGNWQVRFLQILRFGKRFSPIHADILQDCSIKDFQQWENRTKMRNRNEYSFAITQELKKILASVIGTCPKLREEDRYFSNGACLEGNTLLAKLTAIGNNGIAPWGFQYSLPITEYTPLSWEAKVLAVPKSYKAARIIAMEESYRQYENTAVYTALLRKMQKSRYYPNFCIEDQGFNRSICREASINHIYSTIDLSHASDTVSKTLVRQIFPEKWAIELNKNITKTIVYPNGKKSTLQMYSTAGSVLTFVVETLTFWSIAKYATELTKLHCSTQLPEPYVYGDDIIVCTEATQLTLELLEEFGFSVNLDKSFIGNTDYRETCGDEYLKGFDVSSIYWPRQELKFSREKRGNETHLSLTSIVALQQRLVQYKRAAFFLADFVRDVIPDFTSSSIASGSTDLVEIFPISKIGYPPVLKGAQVPEGITRELHYCSVSSYPDKKISGKDYEILDMYLYQEFLKRGPIFEDPLLELLRVSSPTLPYRNLVSKPNVVWRKTAK